MNSFERQTLGYRAPGGAPDAPAPVADGLPRPGDIRTREVLGLPIAMTDYGEAMDVMDGMIARRERGWLCAVAVHAVMVAQSDPEMRHGAHGREPHRA